MFQKFIKNYNDLLHVLTKILPQKSFTAFCFKVYYKDLKYFFNANMNEGVKNKDGFIIIKEGKAEILQQPEEKVFYNPVQEFNRDLSILSILTLARQLLQKQAVGDNKDDKFSFRILEALSATGLRSIRYAKEVPYATQIIANDFSEFAIINMKRNIEHNKLENLVQISNANAISLMHNHTEYSKRFHVVDLDPYGSPAQFLDSAVQCVVDGGMLLVTCTDMAILCGNFPETCYAKYGGIPLRIPATHEMAIRIVLQSIQSHASRYKRYIVPQLSLSVDFYVRIFVKIYTSASACKDGTSNLAMVYYCKGCNATTLQPLGVKKMCKENKNIKRVLPDAPPVGIKCSYCNGNHIMGGPIYSGPIHDHNFVSEMLKSKEINEFNTSKRLIGILSVVREELDVPLYYDTAKLSSVLRCSSIPILTFRSAILNSNYQVSYSHALRQSVKTDAPMSFIWDVMKQWLQDNSISLDKIDPSSPAGFILKQPIKNKIDFSLRPDANPLSRELGLTRYQNNPKRCWGPGVKHKIMVLEENPKKIKNQNRKKSKRAKNKVDTEDIEDENKTNLINQ